MISARDFARGVLGLRLLYKFDARAWDVFDKSPGGFWDAFIVAVIVAPFQLTHALITFDPAKATISFGAYVVVELLSYVILWTLFPFVMLYMTRLLARTKRYFWHLVPYLWMQLPISLVLYSAALLNDFGILPDSVVRVVEPFVLVVFAVYGTYVAGLGLQITTGTAVGLVVLDYVLTLIAQQLIAQISAVPMPYVPST